MLRTESEHDSFGAGHAGTALSAALGMATARDMKGGTSTSSRSAATRPSPAASPTRRSTTSPPTTKRLIVILNDNEWSIDKNVGAIAKYFHKIVTNPTLREPA
jgi:1-deoxy-D-xylulose-5-phosphate synthase